MAQPEGASDRRARLIREMARQGERSNSRLSNVSTTDSINVSANNFGDTLSQQLPALPRATPERKPIFHTPDGDFQINTSALRRAFPDFSQYGSSDEDSMEIGRGLPTVPRNQTTLSEEPTEDITFEMADGKKYRVTGTPPLKARPNKANIGGRIKPYPGTKDAIAVSQKENQDPPAKTADFMSSSGSSKGGKSERRPLGQLHAQVESDDSMSMEGDHSFNNIPRGSRFTGTQSSKATTQRMMLQDASQSAQVNQDTTTNSAVNGTHQSFLLPDLPNITELVSGVRQDGTPIVNRSSKSRSRFTNAAPASRPHNSKDAHMPIEHVPPTAEDQALYVSLQLLQEKVANLEKEKKSIEDRAGEYELEVLQLRSKLQDREAGNVIENGRKENEDERSGFENAIKSLERRLAQADKKVSDSERTIQRLRNDRNLAEQQIVNANVGSEDLRHESQDVQQEISNLKTQLRRITKQHEKRIEKLMDKEQELRQKMERREKAVHEMATLAKELWNTRRSMQRTALIDQNDARTSKQQHKVTIQRPKSTDNAEGVSSKRRHVNRSEQGETAPNRPFSTSRSSKTYSASVNNPYNALENVDESLTKRASFLSFMDGDEVAKLQKIVDEDKTRRKNNEAEFGVADQISTRDAKSLPRKSSLKIQKQNGRSIHVQYDDETDHGFQIKPEPVVKDDDAMTTEIDITGPNEINRDLTQQSQISKRSNIRRRSAPTGANDVTSAFILPDITLSEVGPATKRHQSEIDVRGDQSKTSIPKPLPVSDRTPVILPGQEDPTMRPAQPPALALATVLKALEDELKEIRFQLIELEARYHSHDPALSKRERKRLLNRMQKLLVTADARSDQIYALYDVLEGQKAQGMNMQQEDIEDTLSKIGVDTTVLRGGSRKTTSSKLGGQADGLKYTGMSSDDESEAELDDELVWEGFDPTQTVESLGSLGPYRR